MVWLRCKLPLRCETAPMYIVEDKGEETSMILSARCAICLMLTASLVEAKISWMLLGSIWRNSCFKMLFSKVLSPNSFLLLHKI